MLDKETDQSTEKLDPAPRLFFCHRGNEETIEREAEERRKERRTKKTHSKLIKFTSAERTPDLDLLETEEKKKKKERMAPRVLERMNDINKDRKRKKGREGQIQTLELCFGTRSPGIRRSYDIPHYTTAVSS